MPAPRPSSPSWPAAIPCEVWLSRGERRVNAKSIMGVMMLAAGIGTEVTIETDGEREQEAMDACWR